jgi:CheY-like chemotaxis protein
MAQALPLPRPEMTTAHPSTAPRILIVDDSRLVHRLVEAALRGYRRRLELHFAQDGFEALQQLHAHPDMAFVLLDVNMPGMGGLELLERLAAEPAFAGVPVVLQSTEDQADDLTRGLAAGARSYLPKPFTAPQLHAVLDEILEAGVEHGGGLVS